MAHGDAIRKVDPRGATSSTPRETIADRILRQEREGKTQLAEEKRLADAARNRTEDLPGRSGNTQASRILNIRLFKYPDGTWITPRNMNAELRALQADGYTGPWFPTIPADIPAWIKNNRRAYETIFTALSKFIAGDVRTKLDPDIVLGLPGTSGGFGSGSFGPVYQAPDEAAVKEALQGFQVAVTGQLDEPLLDEAVATYLETHRQDFDDKGQQHDPFQAAKEVVRGSDSYKDIHKLRKESVDELSWVTSQQGRLRTLGLTSAQSESLGIKLARVGASAEAAQDAGQTAFFKSTGRVAKDQRDSLKSSARSVLGLL